MPLYSPVNETAVVPFIEYGCVAWLSAPVAKICDPSPASSDVLILKLFWDQ